MNKYLLYNLVEKNISINQITRIIKRTKSIDVTEKDINHYANSIHWRSRIKKELESIKETYSIYLLNEFAVPLNTISSISKTYKTFDVFFDDLVSGKLKVKLTSYIVDDILNNSIYIDTKFSNNNLIRIDEVFDDNIVQDNYIKVVKVDSSNRQEVSSYDVLDESIFRFINSGETPVNSRLIMNDVYNEYNSYTPTEVRESINRLIENQRVESTLNGYVTKKPKFSNYCRDSNNGIIKMLPYYLNNDKSSDVKLPNGYTKKEFEKKINTLIYEFPEFENEKQLVELLIDYDVPYKLVDSKKYTPSLYKYVKYKYSFNPAKTVIEYLIDFDIYSTVQGRIVASKYNKFIISGIVYELSFDSLVSTYINSIEKDYVTSDDYSSFIKYKNTISSFLYNNKKVVPSDATIFIKMLKKSTNVVEVNNKYYYLDTRFFSTEFWDELIEVVYNLDDFISIEKLYDSYLNLFSANDINSTEFLYVICKKLSNDNKDIIIKHNVISNKGVSKKLWFTDVILSYGITNEEEIFEVLYKEFGIDFQIAKKIFKKELLDIDKNDVAINELDSDVREKYKLFLTYGFASIDGVKKFIERNKFSYGINDFTNSRILKDLGMKRENGLIFNEEVNNLEESIVVYLSKANIKIVDKGFLLNLLGRRYFNYYYDKLLRSLRLIQVSDNCLINIDCGTKNILVNVREKLVDFMDENKIYNLDEIISCRVFRESLKIPKINSLYGIGYNFLVELLKSSVKVNYKKNTKHLFRKCGDISKKEVVNYIMSSVNRYIYLTELDEIIESKYGYLTTGDVVPLLKELKYVYKPDSGIIFVSNEEFIKFMGGQINE